MTRIQSRRRITSAKKDSERACVTDRNWPILVIREGELLNPSLKAANVRPFLFSVEHVEKPDPAITVLEYDKGKERGLRRLIWGGPSLAYRDPVLVQELADDEGIVHGCSRTKPSEIAGH